MTGEFDERQEVVERKEGYHWSISVQLGKSSERVKAKIGGNETGISPSIDYTKAALKDLKDSVKEAHEGLTEEK